MSESKMFAVAREAAVAGGKVLVDHLDTDFKVHKKGLVNLVTDVDLKAETVILDRIRSDFPTHKVLSEEEGAITGEGEYRWVIDPLDGTTNYAHGYPCFCVSIGLEYAGQVILGVVYNPLSQEMFTAQIGKGAFLNGRPIQVSSSEAMIDSLLCTGFSYDRQRVKENLALFERASMTAQATRRDGSAALDLCYVASGRFDGFWELTLHPWDVAAGKLIVEEAGGCVTDLSGAPCTHYSPGIIASNNRIHDALVEMLGKH